MGNNTRAPSRPGRSIQLAMVLYLLLLGPALLALKFGSVAGWLKYVIAASPAAPLLGVIFVVARAISLDKDEFQRTIWAAAMLWGSAATMAATTLWGFLELAGAGHIPLYWVFPFFIGTSLVAITVLRRRYQ